jgi:hypothetical protein
MDNESQSPTLNILVDDQERKIKLTRDMIREAEPILMKMDQDMDKGWQLARQFIDSPSVMQRCQIASNRLLTGLHTGNEATVTLMGCYIVSRLENVSTVAINSEGEDDQTLFYDSAGTMLE